MLVSTLLHSLPSARLITLPKTTLLACKANLSATESGSFQLRFKMSRLLKQHWSQKKLPKTNPPPLDLWHRIISRDKRKEFWAGALVFCLVSKRQRAWSHRVVSHQCGFVVSHHLNGSVVQGQQREEEVEVIAGNGMRVRYLTRWGRGWVRGGRGGSGIWQGGAPPVGKFPYMRGSQVAAGGGADYRIIFAADASPDLVYRSPSHAALFTFNPACLWDFFLEKGLKVVEVSLQPTLLVLSIPRISHDSEQGWVELSQHINFTVWNRKARPKWSRKTFGRKSSWRD